LEQVLGLEAVSFAALEEHLDILPVFEGSVEGVDLLHGSRPEGVDQFAEDGAVLEYVVERLVVFESLGGNAEFFS